MHSQSQVKDEAKDAAQTWFWPTPRHHGGNHHGDFFLVVQFWWFAGFYWWYDWWFKVILWWYNCHLMKFDGDFINTHGDSSNKHGGILGILSGISWGWSGSFFWGQRPLFKWWITGASLNGPTLRVGGWWWW